jgi:hypothetical protein
MENNWKSKSLQNLEKGPVTAVEYSSNLVKRCTELSSQPLNEYSVEDMRVMIGQQIGLDFLVPLALDQLNTNILSEGDYYPGDLLTAVLKIDKVFWSKNILLLKRMSELVGINKDILVQSNIPLNLLENFA